jgi:prefoldin subunit 5
MGCEELNILAMDARGNKPGLEEIRTRIQELRHEIEELHRLDRQQRLSRQSQVPWDAQKQHEARVARMDEIKEELVKLGRGKK